MESESLSTITSTTEDYDSPSSLVVETTISDSQLQEQLITNENTETSEKTEKERKLRRLNRRKALAMKENPLPTPMLGRVLKSDNNTIDLTNDDDDPDTQWFKKQFDNSQSSKAKSQKEEKLFAVPHSASRNAPRSLLIRDSLKKRLEASMSIKRRKEQEQRRKMYEEDNQHLKPPSDDEEEEVIIKKKKAFGSKTTNDDDYNSEEDEDYKEENSPTKNSSEDESDDASNKKKQSGESQARADDEMSVNFLDDSFTYDVFTNVKRPGPGSTVSSFDTRSQLGDVEKSTSFPFSGMGAETSNNFDDILNLCSGRFDTDPNVCRIAEEGEFPDTLELLMKDEERTAQQLPFQINLAKTSTPDGSADISDNDEDNVVKKKLVKKTNRVLDSDDEDEVNDETPQQKAEIGSSLDPFESDKLTETMEEVEKTILKRIVVSGDEESDDEEETEKEKDEEEEEEQVEDEEDLGNDEEEEAAAEEPEPNFDDEDDELAVLKRIEHQEYKQKMKKKTFFDDEASLSGDDVGSDLDDDDEMNLYEAEEGDADDVPDDDTIRRQNHKLLLKQESDREQRALAKLQDRLLADGDLGGVETNRQFRFKLREEVEVKLTEGESVEEEPEDDEAEDSEEKKKEKAQMIKFKIDHAEELMLLNDPDEDNDLFKRAGQIMKKTERVVLEASEEITIKSRISKPSLLSKSALSVSFQEILTGGNNTAPKQMYVQNIKPSSNVSDSTPSSRLSTGGVKRNRQSPDHPAAKRVRQSKLSSLD